MSLHHDAPPIDLQIPDSDSLVYGRILGEFREMPGLILTLAQAARLFNLERADCQQVFDCLVLAKVLRTDGQIYGLTDSGRLCA